MHKIVKHQLLNLTLTVLAQRPAGLHFLACDLALSALPCLFILAWILTWTERNSMCLGLADVCMAYQPGKAIAEEVECLTCRLGSGLRGGWQPALDSGLDQSMAAETTLIYPKGRPAAPPASLRQSAGSHRPQGLPLS